ncbi:fasciculation and elongation protein zeta-2 isoform X2 [Hemibagrus wyckioides]|uniref:fasciculation and elongation protein zeta-2 isoform X2 n=1 Tax=Hemibagrus wyckioides TaxID=337641 RepID=UPI00266C4F0C|nr:fasciculation and elongation protein zeta-2 isoform X2 [Hemibagrus wyckioides]XP_058254124.1 fasciculation and elongation protein zeta-2 isoform X2 [Hemibagrus wyckioides]
MMAAPRAQDQSALQPEMLAEKQLERIQLSVDAVTELLRFTDLDENIGDRSDFRSMEELVADFDEKLKACFGNFDAKAELIDGVNPLTEDTVLKNDEIWNALANNYGNVMPVDWNQSRTRSLQLPVLHIEDRPVDNVNLDVSDDEELREQMDMHSIIVSCINDEPFLTAEQVIEEIEEMMQDSPDMQAEQNPVKSNLIHRSNGHSFEERVRNLSVAELNELLEEVETAIRRYSEELVRQLALRDELDFEKEVMNSFISVLIDVQNLQKEHKELLKKKRKVKSGNKEQNGRLHRLSSSRFSMESISTAIQNGFRQTFGNMGGEKQYLTTVIPYEKKDVPPSVEDLQVLTKILQAMKDDSDKVPSLLTDYILKARSGLSLLALV